MSQFFASGGQSIGVSASASVLPVNTQDCSPLGWTGWISLQPKGLSRARLSLSSHHLSHHIFLSASGEGIFTFVCSLGFLQHCSGVYNICHTASSMPGNSEDLVGVSLSLPHPHFPSGIRVTGLSPGPPPTLGSLTHPF